MHRKDLGIAALLGIVILVIVGFLLFPAFSSPPEDASSHEEHGTDSHEDSHTETADVLRLSKKTFETNAIRWRTAGPEKIAQEIILPGKIAAVQDQLAHLSARVPGVVTAVYKHLGDTVKQGEILARIESTALGTLRLNYQQRQKNHQQVQSRYILEQRFIAHTQALINALGRSQNLAPLHHKLTPQAVGTERSQLVQAYTRYRVAEQRHQREQTLLKDQATTAVDAQAAEKQWVDAQADYQGTVEQILREHQLTLIKLEQELSQAQTERDLAQQALSVLNVSLTDTGTTYALHSPITGTLLAKHIAIGESLSEDVRVFTIANLNTVWAEMMIPAQALSSVRLGTPIEVRAQTLDAKTLGKVSHIQSVVDPDNQTVEAHAEIANPQGTWKPDMFVSVAMKTQTTPVPLAVPRAAVQPFEKGSVVFTLSTQEDPYRIQAVPVTLGRENQDWIEITSGLKAGQRYISENAFLIKAELEKASASHSH
jgi:RND family efflux transporter MFP subunit